MDYESVEETDEFVKYYSEVHLYKTVHQISSLKEICLECISNNFPRFIAAFSTSDDVNLRRNLTFLQRIYSSHFIDNLSSKRCLNDTDLDFLINENLRELDIGKLHGCSIEVIINRIAQVGQGFLKVNATLRCELNVTDCLNKIVCHLSNVNVLHIFGNCSDETLKIIASSCPNLMELSIDGSCDVTDEGLKMICNKYGEEQTKCFLKILSLGEMRVPESGIIFLLKNIPSLEALHYMHLPYILYSMHADDIKNNSLSTTKKYNLTELDRLDVIHFDHKCASITDVLSVWTEVCPNIKTLSVPIEKEDHLKLIARFSELENLNATFTSDSESALDFNYVLKTNCSRLQHLDICYFTLSIPVLIASCPKLESLVLRNISFESEADFSRHRLNSLREIRIEDFNFSEQYVEEGVISILKCSPNMKELSFVDSNFKNSEMSTNLAKFCENCALQQLDFYTCDVDLALLETIILTCSSLKLLVIYSCDNIDPNDAYNLTELAKSTKCVVNFISDDDSSDTGY